MHFKSVLTLIAHPDKQKLAQSHLEAMQHIIQEQGGMILHQDWLAAEEACDIVFKGVSQDQVSQPVQECADHYQIDAIVQPVSMRQKRVLLTDMDSTMITVECIDELADVAGIKPQVAAITERAMRGELEFVLALQARVALLKGLQESMLEHVYHERVQFMPGGKTLVGTMRAHGAYTMLVSGGFEFFTARVRAALGFHADQANRLAIESGKLTGEVVPPILDKHAKLQCLMALCADQGCSTEEALAIGDGANDLPMLLAAGLGVAYHAKPIVKQAARSRINHADLTALLYAQGYRKEEFI